jgi:SH3 domain protein
MHKPSNDKHVYTMNRLLLPALVIGVLLATSATAEENRLAVSTRQNQTMYVNDELWITLRTGPNASADKIKVIKTGTKMTILSYNDGDDYARVRTEDGQTGWVLYRFLASEAPAAVQLGKARQELSKLQSRLDTTTATLNELKDKNRSQNERIEELEGDKQTLETQLADIRNASENALQTRQRKQALEEQTRQQKAKLAELTADNKTLRSRLMLFVGGAGVIGLLIGLYIGTAPLRRDRRWRSMP